MAPARHKQNHAPAASRFAPLLRPLSRLRRLVLPAAVATLVTGGAVAVGVSVPDEAPMQSLSAATAAAPTEPIVVPEPVSVREQPISRSEDRVMLEEIPKASGHQFATAPLNVWTRPTEDSKRVDVLDWAAKVAVTGETRGKGENAFAEIVVQKRAYWVHAAYLADKKPEPEPEPEQAEENEESAPTGLSTAPCASGSDVESGLTSNAIAVHRAVCAAFPEVTSYGGLRPGDDGEHGSGQALDIMITGSTGDAIAEYVRSNAGALGVSEVLWSQQIWSVERSSEGWRAMEDRGSTTANHYDHVHVTVY